MVIKIEFTPLLLLDCKMFQFKNGFKNYLIKFSQGHTYYIGKRT